MTPAERKELHSAVKAAMADTTVGFIQELRNTERTLGRAITEVRDSVTAAPEMMTKKISEYDAKQVVRRRWVLRTLLLFAGVSISGVALALTRL